MVSAGGIQRITWQGGRPGPGPQRMAAVPPCPDPAALRPQWTPGANWQDPPVPDIDRLRREETARGLQFEYCLLTLGASHNRAASGQAWKNGEVLSIDSGGNLKGYIGDICRMGVFR